MKRSRKIVSQNFDLSKENSRFLTQLIKSFQIRPRNAFVEFLEIAFTWVDTEHSSIFDEITRSSVSQPLALVRMNSRTECCWPYKQSNYVIAVRSSINRYLCAHTHNLEEPSSSFIRIINSTKGLFCQTSLVTHFSRTSPPGIKLIKRRINAHDTNKQQVRKVTSPADH